MTGDIDPEAPRHYPTPLGALALTMGAVVTMFFVIVAFGAEADLGAVGLGAVVGFGLVGTLGARLVPEPQADRLGLRGFSLELAPALLLLVPSVLLLSELDNWIRFLVPIELPPEVQEAVEKQRADRSFFHIAQRAILFVGIAPVVEEWLYRGVILQGLVAYLGRMPGLVMTSVLFAFGTPSGLDSTNAISVVVTTALLGLMLGFVRLATGSLLAPIVLRASLNAVLLGGALASDAIPIRGFNAGADGAHTSLALLVPASVFVGVGCTLLMRELRRQPETPPLQAARPRDDD